MTHVLSLSKGDPVIHLKAYGGVQITGVEQSEVQCEIDAPQLATLIEEDGHIFVTVNSSCRLTVPVDASIEMEKGMGSVKISHLHNQIQIDKVLGNLVLVDVSQAQIGKVGGNFAVHKIEGPVKVEKVSGNLIVEEVASFVCEKVGGGCAAKAVQGDFKIEKIGGSFKAIQVGGILQVERIGGSLKASTVRIANDIRAGGQIILEHVQLEKDLSLNAGSSVVLHLLPDVDDAAFEIRSGSRNIQIQLGQDDIAIGDRDYTYKLGSGSLNVDLRAGGSVKVMEAADAPEDFVGDLSKHFDYEDSPLSEMIQERVESATRRAEAKIRAAEIRLEKMRERFEHQNEAATPFDKNGGTLHIPPIPTVPPVPPVPSAGGKGASDEERLMILQMLQDNKISVEEAESLFKALED